MEYRVIRSITVDDDPNDNELQHHGILGQRWGQRRYQNKDGTLTEAGKRRYNKELTKLKAEEEKIKTAEKAAANKQKTQTKIDALEAKKAELEERKKALKGKKKEDPEEKPSTEETVEQKRERLLKSSDAKEIYKDRDVLAYAELNDRINRIDLEAKLHNKIPTETKTTAVDKMNKAKERIESATNLYKSLDSAYKTVTGSSIGKSLAKSLGIEIDDGKKRESLADFVKNIDKKDSKQIQSRVQDEKNIQNLKDALRKQEKEAQQQKKPQNQNNDKKDKQNQQQNQNNDKKTIEPKLTKTEVDKKVNDAVEALAKSAKKSGDKSFDSSSVEKQLEAAIDKYGDFYFLY